MVTQPEGWTPTDAQRELIEADGSRFVEACPGSGKTKAIVARYERLARSRARRGVALLSFTNAAVDEVVTRCAEQSMLEPPNFIGTFDSFINRFITGPFVAKVTGKYPRFIDSWASIPGAEVRLPTMQQGLSFALDWFDWNDADEYVLDPDKIAGRFTAALRNAYVGSEAMVNSSADRLRRQLIRDRQIVSAAASRRTAMRLLSDERNRGPWISLLSARFAEVIVDEAQDSGVEELEVLQAMLDGGVAVVMVADLDQAIYEFRRASPEQVRSFAEKLPAGRPLDGNFRSSPAICNAGSSFRTGLGVHLAIGPNAAIEWPVRIVPFDNPSEVAVCLPDLLAEHGLEAKDCKVLAHRGRDAASAAGGSSLISGSSHKVLRVARAHLVLTSENNPARLRQAVGDVERILLEIALPNGTTNLEHAGGLADRLGVTERWLRSSALRLANGVTPRIGRVAYALELRRIVQRLGWPTSVTIANLGHQLATPSETKWSELMLEPPTGVPWGTIHSVKGREYEAVVLVIPQQLVPNSEGKSCLDLWSEGEDGESRRVLYVGATRARQLLVVAVHRSHAERVAGLLDR